MTVPVGGRWEGGPMRNAAHGRQDEAPQAPPRRDLQAEAAELLDRAGALVPVLETAGASTRAVNETIILALRLAELADALEGADAMEAVASAAYQQGRADAAAARDVAAARRQPSRPRHAGRGRHLRGLPSIPAAAAAGVIVAAGLGSAAVAGLHDEAAVRYAAASPAGHAVLHPMAPDRAVLVPSPSWSPSPRPSVAAATARPAPVVTSSPPVPASSPPTAPAAPPPTPPVQALAPSVLVSVRDLALAGQSGVFTIAAQDGTVDWQVSTDIPGASVRTQAGGRQGVLSPAQEPVTITVTAPPGESGFVYVKWDGGGITSVWVTSGLGVPALALP